jgi:hypothetical protein
MAHEGSSSCSQNLAVAPYSEPVASSLHLHTLRSFYFFLPHTRQLFCLVCRPKLPYLRVYKPHFFEKNLPFKILVRLIHGILFLLTTEPATPVLYVVKLPVEAARVWDCYLASYCTCANASTFFRCIGTFWFHESSRHHRFPDVGRPWHHWQITVNAASDKVPQIFYFHTGKIFCGFLRVIISKFLTKKSRCGLYTRKYSM